MFRGYKLLPADPETFESTAKFNRSVIGQLGITALISLVAFYNSTVLAVLPVTYYASPNGTSGNSGLSPNSPWPLAYAIAHAAASNTVILMSGKYSGGSTLAPQASYLTIKSQVKWGAVICDIPGSSFDTTATDGSINGIVLDGLCISNSLNEAIILRSGSNHVVRNCWVVDTGKTPGGSYQSQTGVETIGPTLNCILEDNLCERNGRTANFDHGFYIGGTNHIVRGNVVRNNYAYGITLYAHLPWSVNGCRVYNNLVYNNGYSNTDGMTDGIDCEPNTGGEVNYIYCNTVVATNGYGIMGGGVSGCILYMSNNIVLASHAGGVRWLTGTAYGDYNLSTSTLAISGPHDVVSTAPNFVNPMNGLYWLRSTSPARGQALANVAGPVDFFGNVQTSVTDLGAFQYNSALTSDTRVLDPSPANPDYWANLSGTNSGSASITVSPSSQDAGTTPVGSTADVTFVVQNNSSTSLAGNASVPAPFSIVSGGSYTLGPGQNQTVAVRYSPTIVGTDSQTVTFTGGDGATATVSGTAIAPPTPGSLTFQAGSAVLSSPMVLGSGYISQPVDTGVTNGGQAVFTFSLTNDGSYIIEAVVNAPDSSANSFFVNIDAQPQDPTMIWDIPPTTGFEQRTISWRGNGTDGNDQFVPQVFSLSAGLHLLVVVGREANVQLQQLSIVEMPPPPSNLRITASH